MLTINRAYLYTPNNCKRGKTSASIQPAKFDNVRANYTAPIMPVYFRSLTVGFGKKSYEVKDYLTINIDRESSLGNDPIFCYGYGDKEKTINSYDAKKCGIEQGYKAKWAGNAEEMFDNEKGYDSSIYLGRNELREEDKLYYAIYYRDKGKWDNNGGAGYELDPLSLSAKAEVFDKTEHCQPLVRTLKNGSAKGRVIVGNNLAELSKKYPHSNEPLIAVVKNFSQGQNFYDIPENLTGIIFTKTDSNTLGHSSAFYRSVTDASAVVFDEKLVKKLKGLDGQFINLKIAGRNNPEWAQIPEAEVDKTIKTRPEIKIPQIIPTDNLLGSDEYTQHNVGPKAYNLKRLEDMKKQGKLKDVVIPRSFAIPCGVYDRVLGANPEIAAEINQEIGDINTTQNADPDDIQHHLRKLQNLMSKSPFEDKCLQIPVEVEKNIIKFKNEYGLKNKVMVRSAFNGEDVKGYSAAGLYDSYSCNDDENLLTEIKEVWASKWNYQAHLSRQRNHIDQKDIQPTVIIQNQVPADYTFTIYTKNPEYNDNNKLLIEMRTETSSADPYIITYDKKEKEKEVKLEAIERQGRKITLDENFNIIGAEKPIKDPIADIINKKPVLKEEWKPLLKKVCDAAIEVEQEFGAAQDIEGGIKFDKESGNPQIYFWQTRDQVA